MKAFGANTHGQLGIGNIDDISLPVNCIFGDTLVIPKSVACGANHSLVISTADELWVSGSNSNGQIGLDVEEVKSFVKLQYEKFVDLETVAAGWNHSLILLQNGHVYALGANDCGQCGVKGQKDQRRPVLIKGLPKLSSVVCSLSTSYGLDVDGHIWGWGLNKMGELGIATSTRIFSPKCIVDTYSVKEIACGQHHLLFLTGNHELLGMGSNKFGQLGRPIECLLATSNPITIFDEFKDIPIHIISGWNFSGCLAENGNVYLWGRCDLGQLGFDPKAKNTYRRICESPVLNDSLKYIITLVSGSESCFAIDKEKNLFSWGWNEHGNCGCGHNHNIFDPTIIAQADFVAAGYGYSFTFDRKNYR